MAQEWKKLGEHEEKVGYKKVTYKDFKLPNGEEAEFTTWGRRDNYVAVIALTPDNKVIVARQFRPGPERILDELPGGGSDGQDLEIAARRELSEETGYASQGLFKYLGKACRDAYTNETNHYFLARDCEPQHQQDLDVHEDVEIALISIAELFENVRTAKMSDGVAVAMAYEQLLEIQKGEA